MSQTGAFALLCAGTIRWVPSVVDVTLTRVWAAPMDANGDGLDGRGADSGKDTNGTLARTAPDAGPLLKRHRLPAQGRASERRGRPWDDAVALDGHDGQESPSLLPWPDTHFLSNDRRSADTLTVWVQEPAVIPFEDGWLMVYVGTGEDPVYRLHAATSRVCNE